MLLNILSKSSGRKISTKNEGETLDSIRWRISDRKEAGETFQTLSDITWSLVLLVKNWK